MGAVCSSDHIICTWFRKKKYRGLLFGQDGVGKTSVLYNIKLQQFTSTAPTVGFNVQTIKFPGFQFDLWDVGGGCRIRQLWHHYFQNTSLIIYIINGSDKQRLDIDHQNLHKKMVHPLLKDTALILVISNTDRMALSKQEILQTIELQKLAFKRVRVVQAITNSKAGANKVADQIIDLFQQK